MNCKLFKKVVEVKGKGKQKFDTYFVIFENGKSMTSKVGEFALEKITDFIKSESIGFPLMLFNIKARIYEVKDKETGKIKVSKTTGKSIKNIYIEDFEDIDGVKFECMSDEDLKNALSEI